MHVAEKKRGRLQHRRAGTPSVAELDDSTPPLSAASAAGIFAEGSRFGAYVIGPCIGHGGMARIYRAEHEGLCRQVALKVLTDGVAPGTEGRARFLREARIAAAIKHPNVVNIFDIGVENQVPYLVMELLVGQDLESLLASHGALSEHTIIDIMVPVVAGLVAVHDAGVVHRDLKPGNIFLSRGANDDVEPKLLDFGISKAIGGADKMRLTSTQGLLMGTPLYMSPEALLGTEMSAASDQYSLGVVLYECATGVNPFISDSVAETARRVTTGQYAPISEQAIRPSRRLQTIIERMMSLDPKERYRDMRALGQELLTLAGQRTRITWGLTFGEVAAAVRSQHARDNDEESTALARTRAPARPQRGSLWPLVAAGAVGVAAVAAVSNWPAKRNDAEAQLAPAPVAATGAAPTTAVAVPAPNASGGEAAVGARSPAAAQTPAASGSLDVAAAALTLTAGDVPVVRDTDPVAPESASPRASVTRVERDPRNVVQRVRPAPRVVEPEPVPADAPEWIIERAESRKRSTPAPVQIGTNDAPIFD
jgi:serine/threonine-protein kinase